jgi:hypothetical protein
MELLRLPFFRELEEAKNVLVAGAGGGFDVFCGLPLYFGLRSAGKQVHLANLSFSRLGRQAGRWLAPALVEVTADAEGWGSYFPERCLAQWFRDRGEEVPIYCFPKVGVLPLAEAYVTLADELEVDTVLLVDGGTDSLMRGDEAGLATPEEDIASLAAVHGLEGVRKLLACIGFGIDTFHGLCHVHFLEAVAQLTEAGAFLGAWSLTVDMPEVALYREAVLAAHRAMPDAPSVVSSSILSAVAGKFDDYHVTKRTHGSTLFINPLMILYWGFQLDAVAERLLYPDSLYLTSTSEEVGTVIRRFRASCPDLKRWRDIPL